MNSHSARRTKLTFALACLLVLLLGIVVWMEFDHSGADSDAVTSPTSIVIKREGHKDITLVKTESLWNMTTPYELIANAQRIEPLLNLGSASFDGYDKAEVDLPATGLNSPAASITIGGRAILLGKTDATGDRRYALIDNKVSFVPDWVWSLVHGGVTAFSDLTVFSELPDNVFLIKDNNITKLTNIEQWQALQADKISAWSNDSTTRQQSQPNNTMWQLSSTEERNPAQPLATLLRFADHTLINTRPGFAFAISNARLDALLAQ